MVFHWDVGGVDGNILRALGLPYAFYSAAKPTARRLGVGIRNGRVNVAGEKVAARVICASEI